MTIDEAIELLNVAKEGFPANDTEKYYVAMELGIEALKDIQKHRKGTFSILLPSETEETNNGK